MDVIAVGAGRDGTVSLSIIIQDIYRLNGLDRTAVHEYEARTFYETYARYALEGDAAARDRLQQLIADFPHAAIVGNGYHMVLDWFFDRYPDLKLIAVRRRDEAAHVKSLKTIATMWPEVFVGYGTSDDGAMRRYSAVQSGEMSVDQWNALSLDQQLLWFRNNVYATVDRYKDRAARFMVVETESLDDPATRQAIADFVAFPGAKTGEPKRMNRSKLVDLDDFSTYGGKYAWIWFRYFSPKRFEAEPVYAVEHALDQFQKWAQREVANASGAQDAETDHVFGITVGQAAEEIERFRKLLATYDGWAADFQSAIPAAPVAAAPKAIDLERYRNVFDPIQPWSGDVPGGFTVDFLGTLTQHRFLPFNEFPESQLSPWTAETRLPTIEDGELWFEALNWFEAARAARGGYVMVTLGANYGAQAVGAARALQAVNPMPFKLVAVEPVPENRAWTAEHMRDNGIDPADHWLIEQAIGDSNAPVLFPVGSPGSGAQNGFSTNEEAARKNYVDELIKSGRAAEALSNLLLNNTTGLQTNLVSGYDLPAEIKVISAVTLKDVLAPFDLVDYLESDIQQSEIVVFPPFMPLLKRKVRRIHIGTHGGEVHTTLRDLFVRDGWEIVFDFAPNSRFETALGPFLTNDGVLTVKNPNF
jgi:hypothetical protein